MLYTRSIRCQDCYSGSTSATVYAGTAGSAVPDQKARQAVFHVCRRRWYCRKQEISDTDGLVARPRALHWCLTNVRDPKLSTGRDVDTRLYDAHHINLAPRLATSGRSPRRLMSFLLWPPLRPREPPSSSRAKCGNLMICRNSAGNIAGQSEMIPGSPFPIYASHFKSPTLKMSARRRRW